MTMLGPGTECLAPSCVDDYPNGEAPKECLLHWRDCWFPPEFFRALVGAVIEVESDGSSVIAFGQGYRFLGVPADRILGQQPAAEFELNASLTSTGDANQWYQKGREDAGFTPSAATPGTSNHGAYLVGAIDCYDGGGSATARRAAIFPAYGLDDPIGSEPWHWQNTGTATSPIPSLTDAIVMAALDCDPFPPTPARRRRFPVMLRNPPMLSHWSTWG